jgi:hypothetical protein
MRLGNDTFYGAYHAAAVMRTLVKKAKRTFQRSEQQAPYRLFILKKSEFHAKYQRIYKLNYNFILKNTKKQVIM